MPRSSSVSTVHDVYRLGRRVLKRTQSAGGTYAPGVVRHFMQELRLPEWQIRKAMEFALTYSPGDVNHFCRLRKPNGQPLDVSLVYVLMYVQDRRKRKSLECAAAKNSWTFRELLAERKLRFPVDEKARKGGRRPLPATTLKQALQQLEESSERWLRLAYERSIQGEAKRPDQGPRAFRLSAGVRKRLTEATIAVKKLVVAVRKSMSARPSRRRQAAGRR